MSATYHEALCAFRDLCEDTIHEGFANEYVRGGVNLLAELFSVVGVDAGERMEHVLANLRRIPMFANPADLGRYGVASYVHDPDGATPVSDALAHALSPDEASDLLMALDAVIEQHLKFPQDPDDEDEREQVKRWQALGERIDNAGDWEVTS